MEDPNLGILGVNRLFETLADPPEVRCIKLKILPKRILKKISKKRKKGIFTPKFFFLQLKFIFELWLISFL